MTPYRLYMNYRCYQITLQSNIFTQIGAVRSVDWVFIIGAPVWGVTGRICDIGQNVLQYSFQTGNSGSPNYFQIFLLIAFFQEAFIRNVIIML